MKGLIPKSHKYWKRPKTDALHPSKILPKLPSTPEVIKDLEQVNEYFAPSTTRTGGSLSFSMIDRKTKKRMEERFYGQKERPRKNEAPKVAPNEFIGKPTEQPKVRICSLPSNYCPDCDTAINGVKRFPPVTFKNPVTREFETQEPGLNLSPVVQPWPEIGLQPGDVVRHAICADCLIKSQKNSGSKLTVMVQDPITQKWDDVPVGVLYTFQRAQRIEQNIQAFMRYAHTMRKEKTFYDADGSDMADA